MPRLMLLARSPLSSVLMLSLAATSCIKGKSFLKQEQQGAGALSSNTFVVSSQSNGETTIAAVSSKSPNIQRVSSDIKEQFADFPPGSLAIDVSISLGKGASIDSAISALTSSGNALVASAPAVSITCDPAVDTAKPFTLSIPAPVATKLAETGSSSLAVIELRLSPPLSATKALE